MTESIEPTTVAPEFAPETFWAVLSRRGRYLVAIIISSLIFNWLGWMIAAPPADAAGVSLLGWTGGGIHALAITAALAGLLVIVTLICTLIVHPDSPHAGFFCAVLGLFALSIRGGNVFMMLQQHMVTQSVILPDGSTGIQFLYPGLSLVLAVECLLWASIILIAEEFNRILHERFFANTLWITRSGPDLSTQVIAMLRPHSAAMGVSLTISQKLGTVNLRRRFASPLALVYSAAVAAILLFFLLQSVLKGQVLFACFTAFFLATFSTYLAFPRVPFVIHLLVVPLTAAAGYLCGMDAPSFYPGHPAFFMTRALPIDYTAAGIPGTILGYYAAFRWSLHSPPEDES